jgi:site-specific DNA recombinase
MLRNRIYCGQIFIPAYKDEAECTIPAIHQALISEELFDEVQIVLSGRKRKFPPKNTLKEELPLRGFLECRKCGTRLTGSASKGNGGRYFYYHCSKGCNERFKADEANAIFVKELEKISFSKGGIKVFKKILIDYTKKSNKSQSVSKEQIDAEIDKNQQRIQNAQQLMLDGQLEPSDYKEIKNRFERIVTELNNKKRDLSSLDFNLPEYMTLSLEIVENLPKYFTRGDLKAKQQLIGSICPEKLIFENNSYRTKRVNEVLALICNAGNTFSDSKKRLTPVFGSQSNQVPETGFEPAHRFRCHHLKVVRLPISPPGPGIANIADKLKSL